MASPPTYREVTASNGRVYRVGEDPKQILGRSRTYMIWLPWVAMMAAGVFEYAYGSAVKTLQDSYNWSTTESFTLTGVWGFFQAGIALPYGRIRETGKLPVRRAMMIGGVFSLIAFVVLGLTGNIVVNVITYGVIGGIGTGLVYATCVNLVGKWYPESKGSRVGFVNGGFGYGSIPFIIIFSYWFTVSNHTWVLALVGVFMMICMCTCGYFMKDPPMNWWPAQVDPTNWAKNQAAARNLKKNPPAAKQFSPNEALRQWQLYVMWFALTLTAGVSLFGISFETKFAKASGFAVYVAVLSAIMLAFVNGTGRGFVGWLSDRLGRKQTLILVCVILGLSQWGVGWSGVHGNEALFFTFAIISGFGSGAFYPMFALLTPDYFGENYNASNYGVVYSGKMFGSILAPVGAAFVTANGYGATYVLAGALSVVAALLVCTLRRPTVPAETGAALPDVAVTAGEAGATAAS